MHLPSRLPARTKYPTPPSRARIKEQNESHHRNTHILHVLPVSVGVLACQQPPLSLQKLNREELQSKISAQRITCSQEPQH